MTPREWWRRSGWPAVVAAASIAGMLAGGVPAWRATVIGVVAGLVFWAVLLSATLSAPRWPYAAPVEQYRTPSAWEVPGLAAARSSPDTLADYLRPRLWADIRELLTLRGIDPASPRAIALVGERAYRWLTADGPADRRPPMPVAGLCQIVTRLAVTTDHGAHPPIDHPAIVALAGWQPHRDRHLRRKDHRAQ